MKQHHSSYVSKDNLVCSQSPSCMGTIGVSCNQHGAEMQSHVESHLTLQFNGLGWGEQLHKAPGDTAAFTFPNGILHGVWLINKL